MLVWSLLDKALNPKSLHYPPWLSFLDLLESVGEWSFLSGVLDFMLWIVVWLSLLFLEKKKFCPRVSPNNLVFPTFCFCHFKPIFTILITLQKSKERGALSWYENFVGRTYWILITIHLFDNYQMRRCQKGKLEMCLVLLIILMI